MSSEMPHKDFNRDDIFWRVADQYGYLFRNVIWNAYLIDASPEAHSWLSGTHYEAVHFFDIFKSRHGYPSGIAAYIAFTRWVKDWFLDVSWIKKFVNALFSVLDWCMDQESNYSEVLVDEQIGQKIIEGAAKMCFRFADAKNEAIEKALTTYVENIKHSAVQVVIRDLWQKDLYPNWKVPGEKYVSSHGQFLQSIFNHGDTSCVSQIYRTVVATEQLIRTNQGSQRDMETGLRGDYSKYLGNIAQITYPFLGFIPPNNVAYYDVKEGDRALNGFVDIYEIAKGSASPSTLEAQTQFLYTLYLSGYAGLFEMKLARLTNEFPTSDFGTKGAVFPAHFVTFKGAHFNKLPLTVWRQLLQIVTENTLHQRSTLLSSTRSEPKLSLIKDPRVAPRNLSVPIRKIPISKKRKRGITFEDIEEPDASRPKMSQTALFVPPEEPVTQSNYVVIFAALGAISLGAVLYNTGRA